MAIEGEYEPSALGWVRDQVEAYEASGGTQANTLRDTGIPVIIVTMQGRQERQGPQDRPDAGRARRRVRPRRLLRRRARSTPSGTTTSSPTPDEVQVQDGPEPFDVTVHEVERRRARRLVGAGRGRLPELRRVPGEDRPPDPGAHRQPARLRERRASRPVRSTAASSATAAGRPRTHEGRDPHRTERGGGERHDDQRPLPA